MTTIRTLAFAEPDSTSWGVAWAPDADGQTQLACREGSASGVLATALNGDGPTERWRIDGDQVTLVFTPIGPAGQGGEADTGLQSLDQLCEVSGTLVLDGSERELNCIGWRSTVEGAVELEGIDSFRQASGWFEADQGLALLALRPRRSQGHGDDLLAAVVLEPDPVPRVADPRLSTTYDADGLPTRVGLELWLEPDEGGEDTDEEPERQLARRAAGEAIGPGIDWVQVGFRLHAALLRWHCRGSDGTGVYLLGRRE